MASLKSDVSAAIADAQARLSSSQQQHAAIHQDMIALNARGVTFEKDILGIEGELRALLRLQDAADGE